MGWWKTAKPGDKVVCVDAGINFDNRSWFKRKFWPLPDTLHIGQVYEVREVVLSTALNCGVGFYLVEFGLFDGHEIVFSAALFRPIQTKSTDTGMSILKRILNGAPVREDA